MRTVMAMEKNKNIIDAILETEYSQDFDNKRKARMIVGFHEYGPIKLNYENGFINAQQSMENCLYLYNKTGNKKYLIDMANFAMIEFMYPKHPHAHEDYGDTPKSATSKKGCIREIEGGGGYNGR